MHSIIRSLVLKTDVSERNGSRFSVLVIRKPLQPVLDSRTRTALAVGMFVRYPARCTHAALLVFINSSLFTAVHTVYCLSKLITPGYWFILSVRHVKKVKKVQGNIYGILFVNIDQGMSKVMLFNFNNAILYNGYVCQAFIYTPY